MSAKMREESQRAGTFFTKHASKKIRSIRDNQYTDAQEVAGYEEKSDSTWRVIN